MAAVFERMGFTAIARHRHKNVTLYRQGEINFILNAEPDSFAQRFARLHGPSVCAIAFRVQRRQGRLRARDLARRLGLRGPRRPGRAEHPGDQGRRRLAHLLRRPLARQERREGRRDRQHRLLRRRLRAAARRRRSHPTGTASLYIDHLTHNVHRGRMKEWADFYERLFNFREIRYFDIEGQVTGVKSKALTSPCGKIRIPINEEGNEKPGQITEYLDTLPRRGHPAHRAWARRDLFKTVDALRASGVKLLDTVDTYYELIDKRIPGHGENVAELKKRKILVDGKAGELLLQIFSENQLGPIFFEFIQRKGDEGFGEGNFKALFESIELDQMRRGVLKRDTNEVPVRLRQHVFQRSGEGALPARPELSAARAEGPLRGGPLRHGVHRAARENLSSLALPPAAIGDARAVQAHRQRPAALRAVRRSRDAAQPAALGPAADPVQADRFHRRALHRRRLRRSRVAVGHRGARLLRQPLDEGPLLLPTPTAS